MKSISSIVADQSFKAISVPSCVGLVVSICLVAHGIEVNIGQSRRFQVAAPRRWQRLVGGLNRREARCRCLLARLLPRLSPDSSALSRSCSDRPARHRRA